MTSSRPIALTGMSPAEQVLLEEALFQPSANQIPGIHQVHDVAQAQLIIANADDAAAVRQLQARGLPAQVLLLGPADWGTGWPLITRPLRLQAVVEKVRRQLGPWQSAEVAAEPLDDTQEVTQPQGLRGRGASHGSFEATQPFIPPSLAGDSGLMGLATVDAHAATQPFVRAQDGNLRSVTPARGMAHAIPPHPHVAFASTQPFTGSHDGNYHPAQQLDLEVPSVAPSAWESDWESEVAEWEARQNASRQGAKQIPSPTYEAALTPPSSVVTPMAPSPSLNLPQNSRAVPISTTDNRKQRILIVSPPGPAATGLLKILQFAGFPTDLAPDREMAFHYLEQNPYRFVFLVEVTLSVDVFDLCNAIRRQRGAALTSPHVVVVSFRRTLTTRIRSWLVGCHAWMTIPLNKSMLLEYLARHGTDN